MKLSMELILESNIKSRHLLAVSTANYTDSIDPIKLICNLVAIVTECPEMLTHETKCCLHKFVKRDGRNR